MKKRIVLVFAMLLYALPASAQQHHHTLLAVFAHPDDERIVGPLLSRYAREGDRVVLVIATDGRKGVAAHAHIPAGDSLANLRTGEAQCAASALGIEPPVMIGLEDAGLSSFSALGKLHSRVAAILKEYHPDAIVTFGPEGGTGHPDHRFVGDVVTQLVQEDVEGATDRLFYPSLPRERMHDAPAAKPTISTMAQRYLTVTVPFEPVDFANATRAFACHKTQYTSEQMAAIMSYLDHGFEGAVHLRPWIATKKHSKSVFQ